MSMLLNFADLEHADYNQMDNARSDLISEIEIQKIVLKRFLRADRKRDRFDPLLLQSAKAAVRAIDDARKKIAVLEYYMLDGNVPMPVRNYVTNGHLRQ